LTEALRSLWVPPKKRPRLEIKGKMKTTQWPGSIGFGSAFFVPPK
jgi:hypothetical protein